MDRSSYLRLKMTQMKLSVRVSAAVASGAVMIGLAALVSQVVMAGPTDPIEILVVNSASQSGTNSTTLLEAGVTYRIVSKGTWNVSSNVPGWQADPECARPVGSAVWQRESLADNALDLLVDSSAVEWVPVLPVGIGCNERDHVYETYVTPSETKSFNFLIYETLSQYYLDNSGSLTVEIYQATPLGIASPATVFVETVAIDSSNPSGATSRQGLRSGHQYRLVATGTYLYASRASYQWEYRADAECTSFLGDPNWSRNRFGSSPDPNDLYVNDAAIDWASAIGDACDSKTHLYSYDLTPSATGALRLKVFEEQLGYYADNLGYLFVHVYRIHVGPVPTVPPAPTVPPLPTVPPTLPPTPNPTLPPIPPTIPPTPNPTLPPTPNPTLPPTPNPTLPPTPSPTLPATLVLIDSVTLNASDVAGVTTTVSLQDKHQYRIVATGTWSYDSRFAGNDADAECIRGRNAPSYPGEPQWDRGDHSYDLFVDRASTEWIPQNPTSYGCDEDTHSYSILWQQTGTRKLHFGLNDVLYNDNSGALTIEVFEVIKTSAQTTSTSTKSSLLDLLVRFWKSHW